MFDFHFHCFLCLKRAKGRGRAVPRQRGRFYEKVGCENEKSITKTYKKHSKNDFFDVRFSFSLFLYA